MPRMITTGSPHNSSGRGPRSEGKGSQSKADASWHRYFRIKSTNEGGRNRSVAFSWTCAEERRPAVA
jgi:hypothetical protein